MSPPTALPLSSAFANSIPSHPLPQLALDPITPRLALIESALLSSPPARILARLGFGPKAIILLAVAGLARVGSKYRAQWRALLGLLGVAEGLGRTVGLLDALERRMGEEEVVGKGKGKAKAGTELKEEAKHVLSWWILYGVVVLAESVHPHKLPDLSWPSLPTVDWRRYSTSSAATTLANLFSDLLTALRRRLVPLLTRFPALALRFPQLLFPAVRPSRPGPRRAYPQPRPLTSYATPGGPLPPSLPVAFFGGEVRWAVAKLVLLWLGLRRDGFGASVMWDWVIGPVCAVTGSKRRKGKKVVRVVSSDEDPADEAEEEALPLPLGLATLPIDGPDLFNLDSPHSHSPPSPHLSPFSSHHSGEDDDDDAFAPTPRFDHPADDSFATEAASDEDDGPSPSPRSPVRAGFPPTPHNVPYKMASSRAPLRSAPNSFQGSSVSADGASSVGGGFDLPDADVTLISADGVLFKVHKAALRAHSGVFDDMFEAGSSKEAAEVPLVMSAKALEAVLGYCGLRASYAFDLEQDSIWEICRAMHKYDVEKGWSALVAAWRLAVIKHEPSLSSLVRCYVFAVQYDPASARDIATRVVASRADADAVEGLLRSLQREHGLGDGGQLMLLIKDRQLEQQEVKFAAHTRALDKALQEADVEDSWPTGWPYAMAMWAKAAECDTAEHARKVVHNNWPGKKRKSLQPAYRLMPWDDLYKALGELPGKLF